MTKENNGKNLINFALNELKKSIEAINNGKVPVVSKDFKKIMSMLNQAKISVDQNKISEEEMNKIIDEASKDINSTINQGPAIARMSGVQKRRVKKSSA